MSDFWRIPEVGRAYDELEGDRCFQGFCNLMRIGTNAALASSYSPDRIAKAGLPFVPRRPRRHCRVPIIPSYVVVPAMLPSIAVKAAVGLRTRSGAGNPVSFLLLRDQRVPN